MIKNNVSSINLFVLNFIKHILNKFEPIIDKSKLIKNSLDVIEKNAEVFKFKDIELYSHQKRLFTSVKREGAKLVLYQAPTGTGKTLSPVGLASGKKVIFIIRPRNILVCS